MLHKRLMFPENGKYLFRTSIDNHPETIYKILLILKKQYV